MARSGRGLEIRSSSVGMPRAAARAAVARTSSRSSSCGSVTYSRASMIVVGYGRSMIMLAMISGAPVSSALSIATRSASGSTRTDSVARTTGRAAPATTASTCLCRAIWSIASGQRMAGLQARRDPFDQF